MAKRAARWANILKLHLNKVFLKEKPSATALMAPNLAPHQRVPLQTRSLYQVDLHPESKKLVHNAPLRSHHHQPLSRQDPLSLLAEADSQSRTSFERPSSKACLVQVLQCPTLIGTFKVDLDSSDMVIRDRTTRISQLIRDILELAILLASRMSLMNRDIQDLDLTHIATMFQLN
jgi:hypothetical protein